MSGGRALVEQQRRNPWHTIGSRITEIVDELDGIATYRLELRVPQGPDGYSFSPGQFNMIYVPGVGEAAISISGDPGNRDGLLHTIRIAGNVTNSISRLKVGDSIGLRGPFGVPWPVEELAGKDVVIVAGGVGLAPVRPLIYSILRNRDQYGNVWLLCGARTPEGLLYRREYEQWSQGNIRIQLTVDRATSGWTRSIGVVTLLLDRLRLPRRDQTRLIACGPEVMMKYVASTALGRGIQEDHIWISMERHMQCAVGLCGHCQLGPTFVCKDGPVFRYDAIRRWMAVEKL